FVRAIVALENALKLGEAQFHACNPQLVNIALPLMSSYECERDYANAVRMNKYVINILTTSQVVPNNWPELGDLYFNMSENCMKGGDATPSQALKKKWKAEGKVHARKSFDIRRVTSGEEHVKTLQAAKLLK
ncbi:hypothetical protein PROFUN_16343, partial [Planoprotostelium fungivorum]